MKFRFFLALNAAAAALAAGGAVAEPIKHPTAVFAGLDKTTGRIINFDVAIDETVQFGALQVTPRVCNTRPQTETPQTTSFVEVDELVVKPDARPGARLEQAKTEAKQEAKRIFSGWMFAASPGLHGVEHPVYDVWLVDCKGGKESAPPPPAAEPLAAEPEAAAVPEEGKKRRSRKVEPTTPAPIEAQPIGPADQPPGGLAEPAPPPPEEAVPADQEQPVKKKKKKKPQAQAPAGAPAPAPAGNPLFPF